MLICRTYLEEEKKDKGSNYPHWSNISLDWEEWDFISVAEEEVSFLFTTKYFDNLGYFILSIL